jgi:copper chaperone CopZ
MVEKRRKVALCIGGMSCASCAAHIEQKLKKIKGVSQVNVNFATQRAYVQYDPHLVDEELLGRAVRDLGYDILDRSEPEETKLPRPTPPPSAPEKPRHLAKRWADYSRWGPSWMAREAEACISQLEKIAQSDLDYGKMARRLISSYVPPERNQILALLKKGRRALAMRKFGQLAYESKGCVALADLMGYLEWFGFSVDLNRLTATRSGQTLRLILGERWVAARDEREVYAKIEF